MSVVWPELFSVCFFVLTGWVALWPLRRALGPMAYHVAALPTGLLAGALAGAVSTLTGRPLDLVSALGGAVALVVCVWLAAWVTRAGDVAVERGAVGWAKSFALAAGSTVVFCVAVGVARFTVPNNDSFISYWPLGVQLNRVGEFTLGLMAARSPLLPGMNAIHVAFGSDWAYVIYAAMAAVVVLWTAFTLWTGPLTGASRRTRLLVAGGAMLFLAIEPSFLFHSFFVHSHMVSAMYLLISLTSLWMALRPDRAAADEPPAAAFLILAGACAAGLALSRPDGLAYQFVPVAAAISVLTVSAVRWRSVLAFFGPLLFVAAGTYAAAFIHLGLWKSDKLGGTTSAAILVVLVAAAFGPWIVRGLDRVLPIRIAGERFLSVGTALAAVMMLAVFVLKWDAASVALDNARVNLFQGPGGYYLLWYGAVAVLVISLFTGDALRERSWTRPAFFAICLFFTIAGVVHGASHEGRIGSGDSFNRVAFHAIPLVVWYASAVTARILGERIVEPDAAELEAEPASA